MVEWAVDDDSYCYYIKTNEDENGHRICRQKNRMNFDARHLYNTAAFSDVTIKQAVINLLRWVYSFDFLTSNELDWIKDDEGANGERHLTAAMLAAKYGVVSLEEWAIDICVDDINCFEEDSDAVEFAQRASSYPNKRGRLERLIRRLTEGRLLQLFRDEAFRTLLARYPETKRQLIDENFTELIKLDEFREKLKADGKMVLRYIDRLTKKVVKLSKSTKKVETDDKEARKRKINSLSHAVDSIVGPST